jgi:serine/threonine-protein kinase
LELEKGFPSALQMLLVSYAQKGQFDLAIAKIQEIQESNITSTAGQVYAISGRRDDAIRIIEELERRGRQGYISATTFAFIYTALGDKEKAIAYLEKGYEERAFQMQFLKVDPRWDKLRDDPRFADLMRRVGLPE